MVPDIILISISVILLIIFLIVMFFSYAMKIEDKRKKEESFFNSISEIINRNNIKDIDDILIIYRSEMNIESNTFSKRHLIFLLERVLTSFNKNKNNEETSKTLAFLKKSVSEMRSEMIKEEPFSDLPKIEKNLMTDLLRAEQENEKELFINKLQDLSGVIKTRYEENKKLIDKTRWSIPLAIVGILVSLAFGIQSIIK